MTENAAVHSTTHGLVLQPDWIVPVDSQAMRQGYLVAVDGTIEYVGIDLPQRFRALPCTRLERTAILPGWVNSHCHLEFSDLTAPIPAVDSFDGWLSRVIEQRTAASSQSSEQRFEQRRNAIRQGMVESWKHGVRWIVDNVTSPWDPQWIAEFQTECRRELSMPATSALVPDAIVMVQPCFELIDVQEQRWRQTSSFAFEQIDAPKSLGLGAGALAPHAPYTASTQVTRRASEWSRSHQGLVTMHLAETAEELQWLDHRTGPLGEWVKTKIDAGHRSHLGTIDQHLSILASAWRSLVVHGNYLQSNQINLLAMHRDRMAVAYCPRTHSWFRHPEHPMAELKSRGVPVLLGTDSRASNPDLNLWDEVRHIVNSKPRFDPVNLVRMITTDAARFLALPRGIGRIEVGGASLLTALQWDRDHWGRGDEAGSVSRSEQELWQWMVRYGDPYPLETDRRLTVVGE